MFVACGIWCLADVPSVSPSSEQTAGGKAPALSLVVSLLLFFASLDGNISNQLFIVSSSCLGSATDGEDS